MSAQLSQPRVLSTHIDELVDALGVQIRRLTELNWFAINGGVDSSVPDSQVVVLLRHQAALASIVLAIIEERTRRM